jgi:hypothetical protein
MQFYVTGANGTTQAVNFNDTLYHSFSACMNGTFTIGDSTRDFQSFNQALNMITTAGICGNVTFLVDSGTYNEQLDISPIPGMGANNTVTFVSATGDSTDVVLQYAASSSGANYVINLDGADYFTFKNMTIKATGSTYGRAITYQGGASFNSFIGNVIEVPISTSSNHTAIYSANGVDSFNLFQGNHIKNGYYGFYVRGVNTTDREIGTAIIDNVIENFYYYGIYSYYTDSLVFKGNHITDGSNSIDYPRALYLYYGNGLFEVSDNTIILNPSSYAYGMYLYYQQSTTNKPGTIANNMLTINGGTGTNYGIYAYYTDNTRLYHNSVNIVGGGASTRALYFNQGTSNDVINNVFVVDGPGYTYYVGTPAAISGSDYNDFYTTSGSFAYWGGNRANLAALKTASSKDSHSISMDPEFFAIDNLHTSSVDLNDAGYALTEVPYDIDGEARSTTTPDIGADEFNPPQWDAGITMINSPISPLQVGSNDVKVTIRNYGLDTLISATI